MVAAADTGELLFAALDAGELGEVNDILDRYPEGVDNRDDELRVPLHYAADCADLGTFQRIFNLNRSLIDAQDQFGFTPLLVSVMAGNLDVLGFLIEQGAQLGQLDRDGHSAVHWAVVCGQLDALIVLLRQGAPIALADIHGAHPLHYATVTAEEEIPPERSEAILHVLLRHEAQLECTDLDGRTPLLWASSDGNLRVFQSLVQAGANRFATDRDRLGILHCAASHGHFQIIQAMLELGHTWVVNAKDRNGDTALFYAATYGHYECAKLLLEKGADANHQDKRIRTAAHCAAAKGQLRILKLLRQYGASFELQNYRGDYPIHEAVQMGSKEIAEWLFGIEPSFVSVPNFYGRTPLHLAAASGNMELVVFLCTKDALVNALMLYKGELLTPLDVAKRRGHDLIVDYLMSRYEALTAAQIPPGQKDSHRLSIEEQLKTAKLRKVRAELLSNEMMDDLEAIERSDRVKSLRRGKSMLMGANRNGTLEGSREMVDASTMISRRSSSASGVLKEHKVPKSTSTTDLRRNTEWMRTSKRKDEETKKEEEEEGMPMLERIQQIVQQELQKAAANNNERTKTMDEGVENEGIMNESGGREDDGMETATGKYVKRRSASEIDDFLEPEATTSTTPPQLAALSPEQQSLEDEEDFGTGETSNIEELKMRMDKMKRDEKGKKVHLAIEGEEEEQKQGRIRRRWTPGPPPHGRNTDEDDLLDGNVTELHILQDGLSPPPAGRMATFGDSNPSTGTTTRYVHERAIFDELTHLKRMQIQYGKVREEVLVRSLVQNFCRMHAIHPSHFRRITTFHQWEKFLYDQLKMIYLEERERLSSAAAAAAQKAASAVGIRPGAIYSAQQRIFASSSSSFGGHNFASSSSFGANSSGLSRKFVGRVLPRTNPLDQRIQELSRIYSGGSNSRSSATSAALAATHSITAKASATAERMRQKNARGKKTPPFRERKANGANHHHSSFETNHPTKDEAPQIVEKEKHHYKRCECLEQH